MNTIVEDLTEIHHSTGRCRVGQVGRMPRRCARYSTCQGEPAVTFSACRQIPPAASRNRWHCHHIGFQWYVRTQAVICEGVVTAGLLGSFPILVQRYSPRAAESRIEAKERLCGTCSRSLGVLSG
jgi:hypothetical protein